MCIYRLVFLVFATDISYAQTEVEVQHLADGEAVAIADTAAVVEVTHLALTPKFKVVTVDGSVDAYMMAAQLMAFLFNAQPVTGFDIGRENTPIAMTAVVLEPGVHNVCSNGISLAESIFRTNVRYKHRIIE